MKSMHCVADVELVCMCAFFKLWSLEGNKDKDKEKNGSHICQSKDKRAYDHRIKQFHWLTKNSMLDQWSKVELHETIDDSN